MAGQSGEGILFGTRPLRGHPLAYTLRASLTPLGVTVRRVILRESLATRDAAYEDTLALLPSRSLAEVALPVARANYPDARQRADRARWMISSA